MSLISLVVVLIIVGILLWIIDKHIPMDPKIKQIIKIVVVAVVVIWIIGLLIGGCPEIQNIKVGG